MSEVSTSPDVEFYQHVVHIFLSHFWRFTLLYTFNTSIISLWVKMMTSVHTALLSSG